MKRKTLIEIKNIFYSDRCFEELSISALNSAQRRLQNGTGRQKGSA